MITPAPLFYALAVGLTAGGVIMAYSWPLFVACVVTALALTVYVTLAGARRSPAATHEYRHEVQDAEWYK